MALVPLLLMLVIAVVIGAGMSVSRRTPPSRERAVAAARAHARRCSAAAVLLGLAAAVGTAVLGSVGAAAPRAHGTAAVLVPVSFGVVHTAVLLVGELTWPRPEGDVRRARLVRRGPTDVAPRWLLRAAGLAAGLAVAVIVLGAVLAEPDGRSVGHATQTPYGMGYTVVSPFPGWFYGEPAALGLVGLALLTGVALWVVAGRPAVATDDARTEVALRRASAHRVLRGAVGSALVVTGGLLGAGGSSLVGVSGSGTLPLVGMLPGLLVVVAGVAVAARPAPRVPTEEPVAA